MVLRLRTRDLLSSVQMVSGGARPAGMAPYCIEPFCLSSAKSNGADGGGSANFKGAGTPGIAAGGVTVRTVARVLALLRKAVKGLVEGQGAVQEAVAKAAEEAAAAAAEVVRGVVQEALLGAIQDALLGGPVAIVTDSNDDPAKEACPGAGAKLRRSNAILDYITSAVSQNAPNNQPSPSTPAKKPSIPSAPTNQAKASPVAPLTALRT